MHCARFKNPDIENPLNENGFVHVPGFLSSEEVTEHYSLYKSLHAEKRFEKSMWNSLYDLPEGRGMQASERVRRFLTEKFSDKLTDYKIPVVSFMVKNPTTDSNCDLHRDYTAFDETRFEYRNGWIPLVDINGENGALYVVPKSNHVFDYPLPMFTEWPYKPMIPELMKHIQIVYAKAGDLVVYKDKTLHGSFQNHTSLPRPVMHFGLLHTDASTCYYRRNLTGNRVDVFSVKPEFFFEKDFDGMLAGKTPDQSFEFNPPQLKIEDVLERIK